MLAYRSRTSPPASEREARMDDPTHRLETARNGMHPTSSCDFALAATAGLLKKSR